MQEAKREPFNKRIPAEEFVNGRLLSLNNPSACIHCGEEVPVYSRCEYCKVFLSNAGKYSECKNCHLERKHGIISNPGSIHFVGRSNLDLTPRQRIKNL